jgi:ribosomal protein S27AE
LRCWQTQGIGVAFGIKELHAKGSQMTKYTFGLKCTKCGSEKFTIPKNPKPNDVITCGKCGAMRSYHRLQKQTLATAKKTVEKDLAKRIGNKPIVIKIK